MKKSFLQLKSDTLSSPSALVQSIGKINRARATLLINYEWNKIICYFYDTQYITRRNLFTILIFSFAG